jgi:CPA1 family monovalent cation:H+ antiporter
MDSTSSFLQGEILIVVLLLVIALVAILVERLRIPYTVALVIVGLAISIIRPIEVNLTPELILALFVPPLVFEAAYHLNPIELRHNLPRILLLAVPGVILTTAIVGFLLAVSGAVALPVALTFGALIAATDPIAIIALFRTLGVPKRLSVLVEGESLLNDGTAIVAFSLMLGIALTGSFSLIGSLLDFIRVVAGGLAVGLALGWLVAQLIARIDDHLIEATLTTVLAFGAYLLAEELHFSGVLAVVAAGLVNGNLGTRGMSPTTQIILSNLWEYIAFLVNSLVFLLIGLQVKIPTLAAAWQPILLAIFAVLAARAIVVYGLDHLVKRWMTPIPTSWQHILAWGGLRGAISLALALSLPARLGTDRELLIAMTFGVVLFTLFVQGTTIDPLLRRLAISSNSATQFEYELHQARLIAIQSAESHLARLRRDGVISEHAWTQLKPELSSQAGVYAEAAKKVLDEDPTLAAKDLGIAHREALRAQRSALLALRRNGTISDQTFETVVVEIDAALRDGEKQSSYKS